jgi:hypothetical protein
MAHVRPELWPEEHSRFGDLEPAFAERGMRGGIVVVRQELEESRAALNQRLAALKAQHPADTRFICVVLVQAGH